VASVVAWLVGAVAAVGVGMLALSLIGDGLTTHTVQPLSADSVAREASAGTGAPGTPSAGPTVSPSASGTEKVVSSAGGTAIVRCTGGAAYLVSWSPEQGYGAHDVARGPGPVASVTFESDNGKVYLTVRCTGDEPRPTVSQRSDDHGGGKGGGNDG
jgi:hypothetical protein